MLIFLLVDPLRVLTTGNEKSNPLINKFNQRQKYICSVG